MRFEIELSDLEDLAVSMSRWSPEEVVEFVKRTDEYMSNWDLVLSLKNWIDEEFKGYTRELAEERREEGSCYVDPDTGEQVHQSPHKECILR